VERGFLRAGAPPAAAGAAATEPPAG
jgi:hypothetical protein